MNERGKNYKSEINRAIVFAKSFRARFALLIGIIKGNGDNVFLLARGRREEKVAEKNPRAIAMFHVALRARTLEAPRTLRYEVDRFAREKARERERGGGRIIRALYLDWPDSTLFCSK